MVANANEASGRDSILLVGNSFTAGIKNKLRTLARSAGRDTEVSVCAHEGWTLAYHAMSRQTSARIHSRSWTTVVLQEQSDGIDSGRYPAARVLDSEIPGQAVFFMTWRDRGKPLEDYDDLHGVPGGDVGYVPIAFELGAEVAPIGWVFRAILMQQPDADLWSYDGHHASERGRYIAALVLYAAAYRESPVGLWIPPSLDEETGYDDQLMVEQVVFGDPSEWNITP